MVKWFTDANLLIAFVSMLTYLPGQNRGTVTLHIEDAMLILIVFWRYARSSGHNALKRNLMNPVLLALLTCDISFAIWSNVVNFFYAEYFGQLVYGLTLFRFVVFLLWILSMDRAAESLGAVIRFFPVLGFVQQTIVYLQSENRFGVNEWLTPLYATVVENSIYSLRGLRTDGTYANPNDSSIGISFFATASLICWYDERRTVRAKALYLGTAFTALYAIIFFCKSRTGTASIVFIIAAFLFFVALQRKWQHVGDIGIFVFMGIPGAAAKYFLTDAKLQDRFSVFTGGTRLSEEGSFAERIEMWKDGISVVVRNPVNIFSGVGVTTFVQYGWLDGGYITYFFISGLVGLVLLIASLLPAFMLAFREQALSRLPLSIVVVQISIVTVSHNLRMMDKLWIPILTIVCYLAVRRTEIEKVPVNPVLGVGEASNNP